MNRKRSIFSRRFTIRVVLAGMLTAPVLLFSQSAPELLPPKPGEEIFLQSDRNLYMAAEEIHFSAVYTQSWQIPADQWSTVLYAELTRWDGTAVAQVKVPIISGSAHGSLTIPDDLLSGNYYLRSYTRWLRNYGPGAYTYLPLKIINPASAEIDPGPRAGSGSPLQFRESASAGESTIQPNGLGEVYGEREKVECFLRGDLSSAGGHFSVSVIPHGISMGTGTRVVSASTVDHAYDTIEYYPETDGISLTARLVDRETKEAVTGMKVALSSFTNSFYYGTATSDERGVVCFNLPYYHGKYEFYMVNEGNGSEDVDVLISNDFCRLPVRLPYIPFELDEDERAVAEKMLLNAQIGARFRSNMDEALMDPGMQYPFYGSPASVIYESEFIQLIDLREFFFELVPNVGVISPGQKPQLFVYSETSLLPYPPLIMIDNIPVENGPAVLEIPCNRIERIEIINRGYVVGPYKYSGIVSIYSVNKDIAGYDLPANSHFFNYSLLGRSTFESPEYASDDSVNSIPDARNTLYWEPFLETEAGESTGFSFYTSDTPGTYNLIIRRINEDGELFEKVTEFEVR